MANRHSIDKVQRKLKKQEDNNDHSTRHITSTQLYITQNKYHDFNDLIAQMNKHLDSSKSCPTNLRITKSLSNE